MEYPSAEPVYFYTRSMPFFELSNFCPPGLEENGVYWPTVEHYFQAQKFSDTAFRERIRRAASPKDARESVVAALTRFDRIGMTFASK